MIEFAGTLLYFAYLFAFILLNKMVYFDIQVCQIRYPPHI